MVPLTLKLSPLRWAVTWTVTGLVVPCRVSSPWAVAVYGGAVGRDRVDARRSPLQVAGWCDVRVRLPGFRAFR